MYVLYFLKYIFALLSLIFYSFLQILIVKCIFSGYVLESTGSYLICQAILGSAQFAGAAVWLAEPWATRYEKKRQAEKNAMKSPEEQQLV